MITLSANLPRDTKVTETLLVISDCDWQLEQWRDHSGPIKSGKRLKKGAKYKPRILKRRCHKGKELRMHGHGYVMQMRSGRRMLMDRF